jgi:hypothetical protein
LHALLADRGLRRLVDVAEQALLRDLAPGHVPGGGDKRLPAQDRDAGGRGKAVEEGEEPVAAAVVPEALGLGEAQGQIVGQDAVEHVGLGP